MVLSWVNPMRSMSANAARPTIASGRVVGQTSRAIPTVINQTDHAT
jgi:hypothetical protein